MTFSDTEDRRKSLNSRETINSLIDSNVIPIINENDLIYCLKNNKISGVGLDVYDIEPLPSNHRLRVLSKKFNLILTPHIGYVSSETYEKFHQGYVLAITGFLNGEPINILN